MRMPRGTRLEVRQSYYVLLYSFENYKVKKIISWNNLVIAITSLPPQIINLVIASLWNVISRVKFHRTKVLLPPFESSHRDLSEFDSFEYLRQSQQKSFRMSPNRAKSVQISPNQCKSIRINPNRSKSAQIDANRRNWAAVPSEPLEPPQLRNRALLRINLVIHWEIYVINNYFSNFWNYRVNSGWKANQTWR